MSPLASVHGLQDRENAISTPATESRQHRLAMGGEQLSIGLLEPLPRPGPRPAIPTQPDLDAPGRQRGQDLLAVPFQPVRTATST
ncbi:MAG TPA: hypothetical protein VKY90_10520 [Candidatus Dormibacteraeota bacterium]|nr:hypothetical protein [Candidatus Dormibacteraeota bacterium]